MIKEQIVRIETDGNETKAEVVGEIVRCRDCKYHEGVRCWCWNSTIITSFYDFCSNGERKETEDAEKAD